MPAAVLIGIPMYSNAAGIIPVVEALLGKGAALGTVLAFMMSVIALSLPEMIILRKVLSVKLIAVFIGVVATGILAVGFLFNLEVEVTPAEDVVIADGAGEHTEHHEPQIRAAGLEAPEKPAQLQYTAPGEDGASQTRIEGRASGRSGNPAKAAVQDGARKQAPKKKKR